MPNTKILVNFKTKKVVHTEHHAGSKEFKHLIDKGYVQVGTAKIINGYDHQNGKTNFYWDADYFEPKDKYIREVGL